MKITDVIEELKKKYPGKNILLNNRQNCTEILCEIEPATSHPSHSTVISIIDKTQPHYHSVAEETYEVLKGVLVLTVDKEKLVLNVGQRYTIKPGQVHEADGNETWIQCSSKPGWKKSDHHAAIK